MTAGKIKIRPWEIDDHENLVKFANNRKIWDNLADAFPHPYTKEDALQFIKKVNSNEPLKVFAIDLEGLAIGSIGIFQDQDIHRKNAAVAYWLAEPFWGRGITVQAIQLILNYAFVTFDITRIYAKPYGYNKASHRVLEKAGLTLELVIRNGVYKNGEYQDEYVYSILK